MIEHRAQLGKDYDWFDRLKKIFYFFSKLNQLLVYENIVKGKLNSLL